MEKKTIGRFIAALRKANGLTQRDLAEKLNVSDKTVSRWERDESYPDLSLIPVIAEIFSVSADELLRGERLSGEIPRQNGSAKGEKQLERLLQSTLTNYRVRSIAGFGISLAALPAAAISNFGFNRAFIGFFSACVFILTALICQAIFTLKAFSALGQDFAGEEVGKHRSSITDTAILVFSAILSVFAFCLPLIILPGDNYLGLTAGTWAGYGAVFALITAAICLVASWFIKDGKFYFRSSEQARRNRLKKICALILLALLSATTAIEYFATYDFRMYAEPVRFDNYEDFKAFMAQRLAWDYETAYAEESIPDTRVYYDRFGNRISEEEAHTHQIKNIDGEVVCEYVQYNEQVVSMSYTVSKTCLPISVITQQAQRAATRTISIIHDCFIFVYLAELAGVFIYYLKKRSA